MAHGWAPFVTDEESILSVDEGVMSNTPRYTKVAWVTLWSAKSKIRTNEDKRSYEVFYTCDWLIMEIPITIVILVSLFLILSSHVVVLILVSEIFFRVSWYFQVCIKLLLLHAPRPVLVEWLFQLRSRLRRSRQQSLGLVFLRLKHLTSWYVCHLQTHAEVVVRWIVQQVRLKNGDKY